jgi:hypothetical protein
MPRRPRTRGRLRSSTGARAGRVIAALALVGAVSTPSVAIAAGSSAQHRIRLAVAVHGVDPLTNVNLGLRPDRLLTSSVPGPVSDTEQVRVGLGPDGTPVTVTDLQRLVIHRQGSYIIRELGPARDAAERGSSPPPVLELGTVVWQGFSPGRRTLAALLTLDAGIESARLPMAVDLAFRDHGGTAAPLRPGAAAPAAGTVTVTLHNTTGTTMTVDTGTAAPSSLAGPLQTLQRAATHRHPGPPPTAGDGLPVALPRDRTGQATVAVTAPLAVSGHITAPGGAAAVTGPGTTPVDHGVAVAGTLTDTVSFSVDVSAGDRVGVDLDVQPWLDPRTLTPPRGSSSWRQWARHAGAAGGAGGATSKLVTAAATAARAAEYTPYLQADVPGRDRTSFHYETAVPTAPVAAAAKLRPKPGPVALAVVAALAILGNAELLRRRL